MEQLLDEAIPALYGGVPVAIISVTTVPYARVVYVRTDGVLDQATDLVNFTIDLKHAGRGIFYALGRARFLADKPDYDLDLTQPDQGAV